MGGNDQSWVRFIGDIHGEENIYLNYLKGVEYTIQVGDLHLDYSFLDRERISSKNHRFVAGNHDNYDDLPDHSLGDFGVYNIPDFGDVFFVRGGWSIDRKARHNYDLIVRGRVLQKKDLWDEEELSHSQCEEALELYKEVKPKLVVSHECPLNVVKYVTNPIVAYNMGYDSSTIKTRTAVLLQAMTDFHRPRMHIFGHYHKDFDSYVNGVSGEFGWASSMGAPDAEVMPIEHREYFTRYVCLNMMKSMVLPKYFVESL